MIGRIYPISKFIFLSIISHGLLIFLLMIVGSQLISKKINPPSEFGFMVSLFRPEEMNGPMESKIIQPLNTVKGSGKIETLKSDLPKLKYQQTNKIFIQNKGKVKKIEDVLHTKVSNFKVPLIKNLGLFRENGFKKKVVEGKEKSLSKILPTFQFEKDPQKESFYKTISGMHNVEPRSGSLDGEKRFLDLTSMKNDSINSNNPALNVHLNLKEETFQSPSEQNDLAFFLQEVERRLRENQKYPLLAKIQNQEGTVLLKIFVNVNGKIGDIKIVESSGWNILDQEAVESVNRVGKFSPLPTHLKKGIPLQIPLVFRLDD